MMEKPSETSWMGEANMIEYHDLRGISPEKGRGACKKSS